MDRSKPRTSHPGSRSRSRSGSGSGSASNSRRNSPDGDEDDDDDDLDIDAEGELDLRPLKRELSPSELAEDQAALGGASGVELPPGVWGGEWAWV